MFTAERIERKGRGMKGGREETTLWKRIHFYGVDGVIHYIEEHLIIFSPFFIFYFILFYPYCLSYAFWWKGSFPHPLGRSSHNCLYYSILLCIFCLLKCVSPLCLFGRWVGGIWQSEVGKELVQVCFFF